MGSFGKIKEIRNFGSVPDSRCLQRVALKSRIPNNPFGNNCPVAILLKSWNV